MLPIPINYDARGNVTHTGSTNQPYQYVGRLGYYTHYQDVDENGQQKFRLLQLGMRFYDPEIGRFTQEDPIRIDKESNYPYSHNRPIVLSDPSGKVAPIVIFGVAVAFSGVCGSRCKNCMEDAAEYATSVDAKYRRDHQCGKDTGEDEANAIKHCVWACIGRKTCGYTCSRIVVSAYESKLIIATIKGDDHVVAACGMDLINDDEGLDCANSSYCYDCCVNKLRQGKLIHLDTNCKKGP